MDGDHMGPGEFLREVIHDATAPYDDGVRRSARKLLFSLSSAVTGLGALVWWLWHV